MELSNNLADRSITLKMYQDQFILEQIEIMVLEKASQMIAEEYVRQNYQTIVAKIDQQALANLVIAEGANAIKDMLDKKLPDKVKTIIKKEVYQKGIFGGVSRIA